MLISLLIQLLSWRRIPLASTQAEVINRINLPFGVSELAVPEKIDSDILDVNITAKAAIAVDADSGVVLYQKLPNLKMPIASITKLMTALVFLESNQNLDKVLTFEEKDRHFGNIQNLNIGERIKISDLFKDMLIASDNEAAFLLARSAGMTLPQFIDKMNKKAMELGMNDSTFVDPTGLDERNISTPEDLVRLLAEIGKNKLISSTTKQKSATFMVGSGEEGETREVKVYTTDALTTTSYLQLLLGKTGYLPEAGYCLATKLKGQTDREIYVVVLGSESVSARFQDVKAIEYLISKNYQ